MGCHLGICGEPKVATTYSLAKALKTVRKARGLSQEAFSDVSSRTYMSTLERDLKSPTLHKLAELCEVMKIHPLTLLTLVLIGVGVMRILGSIDLIIRVVQLEPALFAFLGLMLASTFWSIDLYLTARWSILLLATTLYALYLFMRFDLSEILTMFGVASLVGAIVCLALVFGFPQYGVSAGGGGEWTGVFAQKNALGYTAAITIPSMLVLDQAAPRWRWLSRLVLLMHVALLVGCDSKTMLIATGLTVALLFFYKAFRARKTMRGAVLVALVSTTLFSVIFATANLALLANWLEECGMPDAESRSAGLSPLVRT